MTEIQRIQFDNIRFIVTEIDITKNEIIQVHHIEDSDTKCMDIIKTQTRKQKIKKLLKNG